jgi:hypothetical protein
MTNAMPSARPSILGRFMRRRAISFIFKGVIAAAFLMSTLNARAQSASDTGPEAGTHEIQFWVGGGHSVAGGEHNTSVANLGFRYGWVLSGLHGPGFLRGRFEYAVDAVPMFLFFQPSGSAYAAGVDPVALKWNFAVKGDVKPYFDLTEGLLLSNKLVPPGSAHVNFQSGFALGVNVFHGRYHLSPEIRFMHISNASISRYNPGINTLQARIGLGFFSRKK